MTRGAADQATVAFDAPWGVYRLNASVPARDCSAVDYVVLQPKYDRTISETLQDGPASPLAPLLLFGVGPASFHDAKPQFVIFDGDAVACGYVVPEPLPVPVKFEHEGDAYYATIYRVPDIANPLLALRLQTPNHAYQYVSILTLWPQTNRWPRSIHFNVGQQQMTLLDGKATNTLFCPTWNVTAAG
jgi:hypothetical protein